MTVLQLSFLSPNYLPSRNQIYLSTRVGKPSGQLDLTLLMTSLLHHPLRPLTEKELLERRELARLRHTAREAAEENGGNTDQAKEQEDNGKGGSRCKS